MGYVATLPATRSRLRLAAAALEAHQERRHARDHGEAHANTAQAPAEEKFRKIRLTNPKIAEIITNVTGAVEAMVEMGWVKEDDGEFLVLPAEHVREHEEVREIDDARRALKKWEEEELKRRIAARNKANADPEKARSRRWPPTAPSKGA